MYKPEKTFHIFLFTILYIFSSIVIADNLERGIYLYNQQQFNDAFSILEKEAKTGNSKAQYYLAKIYDSGHGARKNINKAYYWYTKSADQGNSNAQNNLAYMFSHGEGVKKNKRKAFELYSKSATQGNDAAQYNLALFYAEGIVVKQNWASAIYWFRKSAEQDYEKALNAMGIIYQFGKGVPIDRNEAIKWYKKAAEKGDIQPMWNLSTLYLPEDNPGDVKRWDEVYKWYALGMLHGDKKNAPFGMGLIYLFGRGSFPFDYPKATELFTMSAENGKADGLYWLGVMQEYGFGGKSNDEKAFEFYRKAAAAGSELAIRRLKQKEPEPAVTLIRFMENIFSSHLM